MMCLLKSLFDQNLIVINHKSYNDFKLHHPCRDTKMIRDGLIILLLCCVLNYLIMILRKNV